MHTQNKSTAAGHTAGPWIVDDRHIHCKAGLTYPRGVEPETDVIVQVDTDCHSRGLLNETDQANLRLIAAAPTMLSALIAAQEDLADLGQLSAGTIAMFAPAIRSARNL